MSNETVQLENRPYVFYKFRRALVENVVFGPKFVTLRVLVAAYANIIVHCIYLFLYLLLVKFTIFEPLYIFSSISELLSSLNSVLFICLFEISVTLLFIRLSGEFIRGVSYVKNYYDFVKSVFKAKFLLIGFLHISVGFCLANIYLIIHHRHFESEIVTCGLTADHYCWNIGDKFLMMFGSLSGLFYFVTETIKAPKTLQFPTLRVSKLSLIKSVLKREVINLPFNFKINSVFFLPLYAWMSEAIECSVHGKYLTCVESAKFESKCVTVKPLELVGNNPYLNILFGSLIIGSVFVLIMRTMDSIRWIFLTERAVFDIQPSLWDTNRYVLVDAMSCSGFPVIKYLAYYDFAFLTECESERRRKIFNVSSNGGNPRNWRGIYVECIELINGFIAQLEDAVKQEEDNSYTIPPELLPSVPVPEVEEPSYEPPLIVRNLTGNVHVKYQRNSLKKTVSENLRLWIRIMLVHFWSSKYMRWLFMKHRGIDMQILIEQQWQPVSWAVQGLASLVHFSPTEDNYGVIHADVSNVIDVLLKLKASLDESLGLSSFSRFHGQNTVCESVRLRVVMKEIIAFSLNRMLFTCKTHLHNIVIPEESLAKLKEFTDVNPF